jgi:FtsH-binding integral membrane protein
MSMWDPQLSGRPVPLEYGTSTTEAAVVKFFNAVYAWMAVGLAVTASVAWLVSSHIDAMRAFYSPGPLIGLFILQLGLVVVISRAIQKLNAATATALFVLYAGINGVLFSSIFLAYKLSSITSTFAACAGMFAVMSCYGMFTKTNLTALGKILFMALIGLIIATIVNIFVHSAAFTYLVSYAGVVIFAGLTAYDTQRLQAVAIQTQGDSAMASRLSVNGALILYLDFINMFLFLLRILGRQK